MTQSLTEWLQQSRLVVVEADQATGRLRVRGSDDSCSELACRGETVVVTDEDPAADLSALNPGDIIKIESAEGRPRRVVVLRRVWDELASPEL